MQIYNSFVNSIGGAGHTDLHIYHCEEELFLNLLEKNSGAYDYYIIMAHFKTEKLKHVSFTNDVVKAVKKLPKEKLIIMDNPIPQVNNAFLEIHQDFENDIYNCITERSS